MVPHIWNHSPLIKPVVITAQNAAFDNHTLTLHYDVNVVITAQNAAFDNQARCCYVPGNVVITAQNAAFDNYANS